MAHEFDLRLLFGKATRERLDLEAAADADINSSYENWYAVAYTKEKYLVIERNYNPEARTLGDVQDPPVYQTLWAERAVKLLNDDCAHDGRWIVGFTHPPEFAQMLVVNPTFEWRRVVKLFLDKEGDVAFSTDIIDPFWAVAEMSDHHFVQQSEEAYQKWKMLMRDVIDPQSHQLRPVAHLKERGFL